MLLVVIFLLLTLDISSPMLLSRTVNRCHRSARSLRLLSATSDSIPPPSPLPSNTSSSYRGSPAPRFRQHVNPLSRKYQQSKIHDAAFLTAFTDPTLPFHLDIGCSKGTFILEMAKKLPGINFLGLEIRAPVVEYALDRRDRRDLPNCHFLAVNANIDLAAITTAILTTSTITYASIQFPDPHFKERHKKRRVTTPLLVSTLAAAKTKQVYLASDIKDVLDDMRDTFRENEAYVDATGEGYYETNVFNHPTERELAVFANGKPVWRALFDLDESGFTTNEEDRVEVGLLKERIDAANDVFGVPFDPVEEKVVLQDGVHKYVIVRGVTPSGEEEVFVRSKDVGYHREMAGDIVARLVKGGYGSVSVLGGGRIQYDEGERRAVVYGFSYAFGKGDHERVGDIIKRELDLKETTPSVRVYFHSITGEPMSSRYEDPAWKVTRKRNKAAKKEMNRGTVQQVLEGLDVAGHTPMMTIFSLIKSTTSAVTISGTTPDEHPESTDPQSHTIDWSTLPPSLTLTSTPQNAPRILRKRHQIAAFHSLLLAFSPPSGAIIADFGCGSCGITLPLAYLHPTLRFVAVDIKERALQLMSARALEAGLSNITTYCGDISGFDEPFDVGLSLHGCGQASDAAVKAAVENGAAYAVAPCCVGKVKFSISGEEHFAGRMAKGLEGEYRVLEYPRSAWLRKKLCESVEEEEERGVVFGRLAAGADNSNMGKEGNANDKYYRSCADLMCADRNQWAVEAGGYETHVGVIGGLESEAKSDVLVGWKRRTGDINKLVD